MTERNATAFDQWLDAHVAGRSTPVAASDAVTEEIRAAARQFHGLARRAEADTSATPPLPDWKDVMDTTLHHAPEVSTSRVPIGRAPVTQSTRHWRATQIALNIGLVILLLATLGAGIWRFRGGFGGDDGNNLAYQPTSDLATPAAGAEEPIAWGGNNGHTSQFWLPITRMDELSPWIVVDDPRYTTQGMVVSSNTLVQVGTFSENADGSDLVPMMWATALDTGAVLWEIRREFLPRIAISNGLIHALQLTDVSGRPGYSLVSFNLSNGSQYGVSPLQTQDIGELDNLGPLGIGDWRFVSDSSGSTVAFGSAVEYENWMADPNFGRSDLPYTRKGGSQAANETSLYVATGQNHVRRLDLATGKVLFEANLNSEVEGEISNVTLYANLSMVVARITTVAADNAAMVPEMLVILNPVTGEIEETHPFAEIAGEIAIDGSRVYVPTRESPDDAIDIATTIVGSSGDPFMAFDVTTARSANLAITGPHGAGGPLVILDSNGTFWQETQVGTDPTQGLVVFSDLGSVWGVPGERDPLPIVGNGAELIVNDGAGRVTAFAPATDPTVEPSATPASGA